MSTSKVYNFVLQQTENETNVNGTSNLEEVIKELRAKNEFLKQRLEELERKMEQFQFAVAKDVQL